jgi:hypothetical protein
VRELLGMFKVCVCVDVYLCFVISLCLNKPFTLMLCGYLFLAYQLFVAISWFFLVISAAWKSTLCISQLLMVTSSLKEK